MGSPISLLIANLFMEEFEVKALNFYPHPPSMWARFVNDTFVISKAEHRQALLQHINSQDPHIQLTMEEPTPQGSLPFLDTLVKVETVNTLGTSVYKKPTHTDQYLHWDSNHHITAKQSVFNTLAHRAKTVSSTQETLDRELNHITQALKTCQFPNWALNQCRHKFNQTAPNINNNSNNQDNTREQQNSPKSNNTKRNIITVVPYIKGTSEQFKKLCKMKGITVHIKGSNTLRHQLVTLPRTRPQSSIKVAPYTTSNAPT